MKQKTQHIKPQQLNRYAVHLFSPESPDYDGKRLSYRGIERIAAHIDSCEKCSKSLELLQAQLRELDQYLDEQSLPDVEVGGKNQKKSVRKIKKRKIKSHN